MLRRLRRIPWRTIRTRLILAGIALTFIVLFPNDTPAGNSLNDKFDAIATKLNETNNP